MDHNSHYHKVLFLLLLLCLFAYANEDSTAGETTNSVFPRGHLQPFGAHKPPIKGVIDVVDTPPSSSDFYTNYVRESKPLLMKGAANNWPATLLWKDEDYLLENFGEEVFRVDLRKVWDDKHPPRMNMYLKDFLQMYKQKPIYLDSPFPTSGMLHDTFIPAVHTCEELYSKIDAASLLYSSGNTSYVFHQDGYENIITVLSGRKTFLLAHPRDSHKAYANNFTTLPGLSPIVPEKVDLLKFPKVADLDYYEVEIEAGDQLYVPMFWWHQVRSYESPNIAVSMWFYVFDNNDELDEANVNPDIQVEESVLMYLDYIQRQPERIKCKKTAKNKKLSTVLRENNADDPQNANVIVQQPPDKLLNSGYTIPVLGFGTGLLGDRVYAAVKKALEVGYRMIDTAQGYPGAEEAIAQAIKESEIPRSDIIIVDKLHPKNHGYQATIKSVEESLEKLQTNYIDVFLIHSVDCDDYLLTCDPENLEGTWQDSWKALEKLQGDGKIRSIGVSNFDLNLLNELLDFAKAPVSIVQNWFDLFHRDSEVRRFCKEHGIQYMAYSVLGQQWTFNNYIKTNPVLQNPMIQAIAYGQQRTPANIIVRWAMSKDLVVLTRSSSDDHILTNFQSLEVLLQPSELQEIETNPEIDLAKIDAAMDKFEENNADGYMMDDVTEFIRQFKLDDEGSENDDEVEAGSCATGDTECNEEGLGISENDGEVEAGSCEAGDGNCNEETLSKYSEKENAGVEEGDEGITEWSKPEKPGSEVTLFEKVDLEDETIYFGAEDSYMYAMDGRTGKIKWKFQTSYSDLGSCPTFSPDGKLIYFGGEDSYFYALSAEDGSKQWHFETDQSIVSSPALGKDDVIFFGGMDGFMYALLLNGELKWKTNVGVEIMASPLVASFDDSEVVFITAMGGGGQQPNAFMFDASNGEILFQFATDGDPGFFASPKMSLDGSQVYFCSLDGEVYVRKAKDGSLIKLAALNVEINSSPAVTENTIIIGTSDGDLVSLHKDTLKVHWVTSIGGYVMSSPCVGPNNVVYIGSGDGKILAANVSDGKILWTVQTEEKENGIWSSPRFSKDGQRLFIGAFDGHMYCLKSKNGEILWKTMIGQPIVSSVLTSN
ncbi:uncharacterized protein [Ptychodera flava]|uniref:uncharacterized protein n=1 Tax=Ptychodera flava TaxID=63121 RepID=UPI00396A7FB5